MPRTVRLAKPARRVPSRFRACAVFENRRTGSIHERLGGERQIECLQLDRPFLEGRHSDLRIRVCGQPAPGDVGELLTGLEAEEANPRPRQTERSRCPGLNRFPGSGLPGESRADRITSSISVDGYVGRTRAYSSATSSKTKRCSRFLVHLDLRLPSSSSNAACPFRIFCSRRPNRTRQPCRLRETAAVCPIVVAIPWRTCCF